MRPEVLKAVREREKELFQECPHCVPVRPLLDALRDAVHAAGPGVVLAHPTSSNSGLMDLDVDCVSLECKHCRGTGKILTELGAALAALIPMGTTNGEDDTPF